MNDGDCDGKFNHQRKEMKMTVVILLGSDALLGVGGWSLVFVTMLGVDGHW